MATLTKKQKELMGWVNKVSEEGTHENSVGYFYAQNWKKTTIKKLLLSGLIELYDANDLKEYNRRTDMENLVVLVKPSSK